VALASLKTTSFPGTILILDDGSQEDAWHEFRESIGYEHAFEHDPVPKGLTVNWNHAYQLMLKEKYDYLIITNNDVIFTKGWWEPLIQAFTAENCGISGPMTNQPGHQPHQSLPIDNPIDFVRHATMCEKNGAGFMIPYVNGFCFCLKADRLVPFDEDAGMLFDESNVNYGAEDKYQKRMREAGLTAYAMSDSMVYHFKDVSFESWSPDWNPGHTDQPLSDGLNLENLPQRLAEDTDFKIEEEVKT
jgi:GT2 family glycosyltransferase